MIASIIETTTLAKAILYSVVSGVGIAVVFAAGVSSAAGLVDAVRERRTAAGAAWAVLAVICLACSLAAVVLGIVAMTGKG
jgi:uncharacterized membrane-anchored protein YitT (DUF2179 family)